MLVVYRYYRCSNCEDEDLFEIIDGNFEGKKCSECKEAIADIGDIVRVVLDETKEKDLITCELCNGSGEDGLELMRKKQGQFDYKHICQRCSGEKKYIIVDSDVINRDTDGDYFEFTEMEEERELKILQEKQSKCEHEFQRYYCGYDEDGYRENDYVYVDICEKCEYEEYKY